MVQGRPRRARDSWVKGYLEGEEREMKTVEMTEDLNFDDAEMEKMACSRRVERCGDGDLSLGRTYVLNRYSCGVCGTVSGLDRDDEGTDNLWRTVRLRLLFETVCIY